MVLAVGMAACANDNTPRAGALAVSLVRGGANDGALLVTVSGGPVTGVTVGAGYQQVVNADAAGTHIMVIGDLTTGAIATLTIPDRSQASRYTVTLDQVADRTTFGLIDPAQDSVSIGAAP